MPQHRDDGQRLRDLLVLIVLLVIIAGLFVGTMWMLRQIRG